jgi:hypothetical protein
MAKILVHEKALAHLSRGLYRSPASALRELVSNAWDANAKVVRINTNYPIFHQLSVEDDGDGFTKAEFERLMGGGVGNSQKRPIKKELINHRPVIGRLGIGMLGIAQICGSFTITSKPKKGEGFRARVRLYDLLRQKLDAADEGVVVTEPGNVESVKEVDVGEYEFEEFDPNEARFGTVIASDDVHPTFVSTFQKSLSFEEFREPPLDWGKALRIVSKVRSLQELGDYWRLLWELAVASPIPYLNEDAVPEMLIADDQKRLLGYNFKVIVDNVQLAKPVLLKDNPNGYTTRKIGRQTERVYAKDLVFHGYIVVQEGSQLRPDELRGIVTRIRNVAIGFYDPSMLDYRYNEGPRSRWLTGEIFVDEGLEDALNIDRDSFNRFHPEFRVLQQHVHRVLHEEVFPETYRQIEVRSNARTKEVEKARTTQLRHAIAEELHTSVTIHSSKEIRPAEETAHVTITEQNNEIDIKVPRTESLKTKKSYRQLAGAILAIHEISLRERTRDKQRNVFAKLLLSLLSKW